MKFHGLEQPNFGLEGDAGSIKDLDLQSRNKFIYSCKDSVWWRRTKEYLRGLWELHDLAYNLKHSRCKQGDNIIRDSEKERTHLGTGIFHELLPGDKNITRAVKLRAGKLYLELAVEQFYPFKLRCDQIQMKEANKI